MQRMQSSQERCDHDDDHHKIVLCSTNYPVGELHNNKMQAERRKRTVSATATIKPSIHP